MKMKARGCLFFQEKKIIIIQREVQNSGDWLSGVFCGYSSEQHLLYCNIIINKGMDILEIHSDCNRSFEKAILKTAPLDTSSDIDKEIEF